MGSIRVFAVCECFVFSRRQTEREAEEKMTLMECEGPVRDESIWPVPRSFRRRFFLAVFVFFFPPMPFLMGRGHARARAANGRVLHNLPHRGCLPPEGRGDDLYFCKKVLQNAAPPGLGAARRGAPRRTQGAVFTFG